MKKLFLILLLGIILVGGCTNKELAGDQFIDPDSPYVGGEEQNSEMTEEKCTSDWSCTKWLKCTSEGKQTRTCTDMNKCNDISSKPTETQTCEYVDTSCPDLINFEFHSNYSGSSPRLYFLGQFERACISGGDGLKIGDWKVKVGEGSLFIYFCDKERNETYATNTMWGIWKGSKQGENINYYYIYIPIEKKEIEIDSSGNIGKESKESKYLKAVFDIDGKLIEQKCLTNQEYLDYLSKPRIV